jgi:TonB family protein
VLKSPPQSSGFPVTRISDQKLEFVSTLPAPEVAPRGVQNAADVSIDDALPKQRDSATKLPVANVSPRIVQNPASVSSEKPSNGSANGTSTVVQGTTDGRPPAPAIQNPSPVARPDADMISEKIVPPAALPGMQVQNRSAAKPTLPNVPFGSGAGNVPAPANDPKNVALEVPAASDLPDWSIAESFGATPVADRSNYRNGIAPRDGALTEAPAEITAQANSPAVSSENSAISQSLNWKSLAAAILVVILLSFAAGWIAAGPGGRKQILDKFVSQQSDSSQPPENPGVNSAQTDAPVSGAGLPQTNATTASSEQTTNPTMSQPASQILPPNSTQPALPTSQVSHAAIASPQPASQTPRPTVTSTGNVASSAPDKLAGVKRDVATSSSPAPRGTNSSSANAALAASNRPSVAANTAAPANAVPRESHTSQPNSNSSSQGFNPSSANDADQPQPMQPNAAAASSNPPSFVAKSAPSPVPASASSPAPTATAAEVVKATVSVNASPFPSIRVPPELKSQISKQGASLQIGQLISRVDPTYPEDAQHQRVEGVVKLRAIIARDGSIQDIDQTSGPPLLVAAAANAVRQWHYKATSLDGQPVEATESITVTFRLQSARAN